MASKPDKNEDKPRISDLPRFRLIPVTIIVAGLLLCVKTNDVIHDSQKVAKAFFAPDVVAEEPAAADAKKESAKTDGEKVDEKDAAKTDEKTADTKPAEEKKDAEAPKANDKKEIGMSAEKPAKTEEEKKEDGETTLASVDKKDAKDAKKEPQKQFSPIEVDILQSLSKRREEIDEWAQKVEVRENLLKATEMRIDGKVTDLGKLKKDVETLLGKYQEQEDTKIKSLVKIYENMKPKDAAAIFNEMEMPILLQIVDRMSERKAAPILAGMTPTRAKELTTELAEQRKLDKPVLEKATSAAAAQ